MKVIKDKVECNIKSYNSAKETKVIAELTKILNLVFCKSKVWYRSTIYSNRTTLIIYNDENLLFSSIYNDEMKYQYIKLKDIESLYINIEKEIRYRVIGKNLVSNDHFFSDNGAYLKTSSKNIKFIDSLSSKIFNSKINKQTS